MAIWNLDAVYNGLSSPSGIITDGLVLHLDAGNPESYPGTGTTWYDLSGNTRNASILGTLNYSTSNGGVFTLNGTNAYMSVPNFDISGSEISFGAWFRMPSLPAAERAIIRKNERIQLGCTNWSTGSWRNLIATSGTTGWSVSYDFTSSISTNNWYYVMVVYSTGSRITYINGAPVNTTTGITGNVLTNSNNLLIGRDEGSNTYTAADVSAIEMYNRKLTATEVEQNYNALKGRYGL